MKMVAFTRPDIFSRWGNLSYPYQRVLTLHHDDGIFGESIGERATRGLDRRDLELPKKLGHRLMAAFSEIVADEPGFNCHRFSREMAGLIQGTNEPIVNPEGLPKVGELAVGAVGLVGSPSLGVPHSIGCGLGGEDSLQVMSWYGEFGFAANGDVVNYYRQIYLGEDVGLYQMPNPDT